MSQTLILSVGSDPMVLDTRELILRSTGYTVSSALSTKEAVDIFQNGDFDIVILCHSLPTKECELLASFIRASGSHTPIVCVSGTGLANQNVFADATLDKDPAEFLRSLRDLLGKRRQMPSAGVPVPHVNAEVTSAKKALRLSSAFDRYERENRDHPGTLSFLEPTRERAPSH
jgi:CheY-like chemotaxis protein